MVLPTVDNHLKKHLIAMHGAHGDIKVYNDPDKATVYRYSVQVYTVRQIYFLHAIPGLSKHAIAK